jgi:hypothetical protein
MQFWICQWCWIYVHKLSGLIQKKNKMCCVFARRLSEGHLKSKVLPQKWNLSQKLICALPNRTCMIGTPNQPIETKKFLKKVCLVPQKWKGDTNSFEGICKIYPKS